LLAVAGDHLRYRIGLFEVASALVKTGKIQPVELRGRAQPPEVNPTAEVNPTGSDE